MPPLSLRARWVLPVAGPAIEGGWVTVHEDRIVSVGTKRPSGTCRDLGNVALLPGLVNAHTHLDLSNIAGPLGRPGMRLVDWLGEIVQHRLVHPPTPAAVEKGLRESSRLGTTTLADIAQDTPSDETTESAGPEVFSFLELIAPTTDRVGQQIERAEKHLAASDGAKSWRPGLSPHAPYSVHPDLLVRAVALSAEHHVPLAMHLAESPEELELIRHGRGPFRELLKRLGAWDADAFPVGLSVLDTLRTLAGAHRALVIHGNYLGEEDIALLADQSDRMAVVYCPRTHAFFAHDPYPLEKLLAAGVVVALGTDSRASSPDLDVLAEMREVHRRHPGIGPEVIVRLATAGGATALGQHHRWGTIEPGRRADLVAIALPEATRKTETDPCRLLLECDGPVVATWCGGRQSSNAKTQGRKDANQ